MKNKVCIATWWGGQNFGTNLQAYGLKKKLELLGYETNIKGQIRNNMNYFIHPFYLVDRILTKIKYLKMNKKTFASNNIDECTQKKVQKFKNENFCILNSYNRKSWKKIEKDYIAFIVGSDQVWNPYYFDSSMMLSFIKNSNLKKISYASSLGVKHISFFTKLVYKHYLSSFEAISVREKMGAKLLNGLVKQDVNVVLDPTLLLTRKVWDEFADSSEIETEWPVNSNFILCYFVGNNANYETYVKKIIKNTGYNCLVIPLPGCHYNCGINLKGVGPKEFIWLIKHAKIVCTDSFHCSVFSIIYHKEFYVLKRFKDNSIESQNSRIYELLESFELSQRLIENDEIFDRNLNINYENVDKILNQRRKDSESFLVNALKGK